MCRYLEASSDFDISKMTHDQIDRLVHYGKLMQGMVLTSHAPHMANGEIGVLLPGRNPFHYPSGETHMFETKEIIETQQYAHLAGSRATLGSSYSKTTKHKHAAAAWWDVFAGAEADSEESSYAESRNSATNSKSKGSENQKLKVMTQESHATMMQFLVADADFYLSPEFERALVDCETAYTNRKIFTDAYQYEDRAPRWLLREFGTHFATSARLGGSYYLDATIDAGEESKSEQKQTALKFAIQTHGSNADAAVAVFPMMAAAGQDAGDKATTKEGKTGVYTQNEMKESKKDVSMHVHVTGGKYGNITEWQKEVSQNPDSWRVIDREFSRRLRPVWSLVFKSQSLDPENMQAVSDMLYRAWLRTAFDDESADGVQVVSRPTKALGGNLWPEDRTTIDLGSCPRSGCDLGMVKMPDNFELSFRLAIDKYENFYQYIEGALLPIITLSDSKIADDDNSGGFGFHLNGYEKQLLFLQDCRKTNGDEFFSSVFGPAEKGESEGPELGGDTSYDIVITSKNSKLELRINDYFYGMQGKSTCIWPRGTGHLLVGNSDHVDTKPLQATISDIRFVALDAVPE